MGKVIFADNILKRKGIEKRNFDTSAFNEVVEKFFMNNDAKATILLMPKRFVALDNPPEGDFLDYLDVDSWEDKQANPNDPLTYDDVLYLMSIHMRRPILMINEPFITNAAGYLRSICGFNVQKKTKNGKKMYIVSLPI